MGRWRHIIRDLGWLVKDNNEPHADRVRWAKRIERSIAQMSIQELFRLKASAWYAKGKRKET